MFGPETCAPAGADALWVHSAAFSAFYIPCRNSNLLNHTQNNGRTAVARGVLRNGISTGHSVLGRRGWRTKGAHMEHSRDGAFSVHIFAKCQQLGSEPRQSLEPSCLSDMRFPHTVALPQPPSVPGSEEHQPSARWRKEQAKDRQIYSHCHLAATESF